MNTKNGLISALHYLTSPMGLSQKTEHRQTRLLAWILLLIILFCTTALLIMQLFMPDDGPARKQYIILISGLILFFTIAYMLNCSGHYHISATFLVGGAIVVPWTSFLIDPSILQGDIIPLIYVAFSVTVSSIFFPTYITFGLAIVQFIGLLLILLYSPIDVSNNWLSFLAYVFLTSLLSILTNHIIQNDMKQIAEQTRQLSTSKALLQELSIRDHLTNLFNRRYLEETLEREIQRASDEQIPLSIIILDVDKFKHINDNWGHAAGDTVLQELGAFLTGKIRQSDTACRYGGDEFVLVLPDTSLETATKRAEYLKEEIRNSNLSIPVMLSFGVAAFPDNGTNTDILLKSADAALYQSKHDGGNCIIVAK